MISNNESPQTLRRAISAGQTDWQREISLAGRNPVKRNLYDKHECQNHDSGQPGWQPVRGENSVSDSGDRHEWAQGSHWAENEDTGCAAKVHRGQSTDSE